MILRFDKHKDHDLISWLSTIEGNLHSYLIRQSMRYVKENNVPILIAGKMNNEFVPMRVNVDVSGEQGTKIMTDNILNRKNYSEQVIEQGHKNIIANRNVMDNVQNIHQTKLKLKEKIKNMGI